MSVAGKDGAWVSIERLIRIKCSTCGDVFTGWFPNDREIEDALVKHLQERHGGVDRGLRTA